MGFQFLELISHSKEALIRATEGMLSTVIMQKKKKKKMLNKTQLFGKRRWEVGEDIWVLWQGNWNWYCLRLSNQEMEASYKVV